jgi:hypothetical protein
MGCILFTVDYYWYEMDNKNMLGMKYFYLMDRAMLAEEQKHRAFSDFVHQPCDNIMS